MMKSCSGEERRLSRIAGADTGERQTAQRALVAICVSLVSLHVVSWRLSSWMRLACPASSLDKPLQNLKSLRRAEERRAAKLLFLLFSPLELGTVPPRRIPARDLILSLISSAYKHAHSHVYFHTPSHTRTQQQGPRGQLGKKKDRRGDFGAPPRLHQSPEEEQLDHGTATGR